MKRQPKKTGSLKKTSRAAGKPKKKRRNSKDKSGLKSALRGESVKSEIESQVHFLKAIADINPDMISVINLETNELEFVNSKAFLAQGFGSETERFEKKEMKDHKSAVHPDHRVATENYFRAFLSIKDDEVQKLEYCAVNNRGELHWYHAQGKVFKRNNKGIPTHAISIVRNITDQKKAEQEIKEQEIIRLKDEIAQKTEDNYRKLFESIDEGFVIGELVRDEKEKVMDYRFIDINPAFERQMSRECSSMIDRPRIEIWPLDKMSLETYEHVVSSGRPMRKEYYSELTGQWNDVSVFPRGGDKFAVLFDNITDRKKTEEALQKSRQMLSKELSDAKRLQRVSNSIIEEDNVHLLYEAILDSAMEIMSSDFASIQILIPETNQLYLLAHKGFHPDSAKYWEYVEAGPTSSRGQALATGKRVIIHDMDRPSFDMDKGDCDSYLLSGIFSVQSSPLISRWGNHVGMISTHWRKPHHPTEWEFNLFDVLVRQTADLIERKKGEEALKESKRRLKELNESLERRVEERTQQLIQLKIKQEKEKLNAVIFAQEQERIRIGEGLHNGVAQLLYAVQSRLQLIDVRGEKDEANLKTSLRILSDAIQDARHISFQLMPPVLKDFGLATALDTLVSRIFNERIRMKLNIDLKKRLSEDLEISIYRIVQEVMNNIVKHADASEATIEIQESRKSVKVRITDNGKGFSLTDIGKRQEGLGLQIIRNRVRLLNGKIKFGSPESQGTIIDIRIPVQNKK